eukprot:10486049-Karenia_brevis.AAC.1
MHVPAVAKAHTVQIQQTKILVMHGLLWHKPHGFESWNPSMHVPAVARGQRVLVMQHQLPHGMAVAKAHS